MSLRQAALAAAVSFVALHAGASAASALESFTLENVRAPLEKGEGELVFKRVEIVDTNLTRAEIDRLFAAQVDAKERGDILARMQAKRVAIPEVVMTKTGPEKGSMTLRDYVVENLDGAKFSRLAVGGLDGSFTSKEGGQGEIASGPLVVEDADFTGLVRAAKAGDVSDGTMKVGGLAWSGFRMSVPDSDVSAKAAGGNLHTVRVDSVESRTSYDGDAPTKAAAKISGVVFQPAPSSEAARALKGFGFEKVDMGLTFAGDYDPAAKTFTLTDYTLSGVDAGALTIAGAFANLGRQIFTGSKDERLTAMMEGALSGVTVNYVDRGLFEKSLAFYALNARKQVEAVRSEWAMMVTGMLPMLMGGDPSALKVAEALGTFVRDPKSLSISIRSKGPAVSFAEITRVREPGDFFSKFELTATANK